MAAKPEVKPTRRWDFVTRSGFHHQIPANAKLRFVGKHPQWGPFDLSGSVEEVWPFSGPYESQKNRVVASVRVGTGGLVYIVNEHTNRVSNPKRS